MERDAKTFEWLDIKQPSLEGYLKALLPRLDQASEFFINEWRAARFYKSFTGLQEDIDIYHNLLSGGKKLRASLVVLGYENFRGNSACLDGILTAAVSYEVIHNSFLIHDDIEDDSNLRRGQPTVHERYRINHEDSDGLLDHRQYSIAVALNTGSLGAIRGLEMLWKVPQKADLLAKAQQWLTWVMGTTLQGQRRDLADIPLVSLSEKLVYEIHHQKTAVYTVVGPLTLGAILAGASDKQLGYVNAFGVNLGIAFQIIDDHLGLYGDEKILGKPIGSDLVEGKKTLQFFKAYQQGSNDNREFLRSVWGKQTVNTEELERVKLLVDRLGAKDYGLWKAKKLSEQAKRLVPKIASDQVIASILDELADFVVSRSV